MVNDLKDLMRQNVAAPPPDHLDVDRLMAEGNRRVRRRRTRLVAIPAVLVVGVFGATVAVGSMSNDGADPAASSKEVPKPDAPTITLGSATRAVEGRDYEVLASYTNADLDADNGQYFDGVTDDGLILFRDGPRSDQLYPRYALMDPATGDKDWLPKLAIGQNDAYPVILGEDELVLVGGKYSEDGYGMEASLVAHIFDRTSRTWRDMTWHGLPATDFPGGAVAHDGRLYVKIPATQGAIPEGGWPMGPDGEADDANADGDTYSLMSVSLTDASDVRDEHLTVGDVAFNDTSMVYTDSTNGAAGNVHVVDLATGDQKVFDPRSGEKCNLLSFGVTDEHIVMSEYCGTYAKHLRDDRVQVLTMDGDQEFTLQDNGIDGYVPSGNVIQIAAYDNEAGGTFVYDLDRMKLLRLSDKMSHFALGGFVPDGLLMWDTATKDEHGATQWVGRLITR